MAKKHRYECVGGPLCGTKINHRNRFIYFDGNGQPHFYRFIRLIRKSKKVAEYFHYFGSDIDHATFAPPCMSPGDRAFKPLA
jgi:hypothetical protein